MFIENGPTAHINGVACINMYEPVVTWDRLYRVRYSAGRGYNNGGRWVGKEGEQWG